MRRPWPPASTMPVTSARACRRGMRADASASAIGRRARKRSRAGEQQVVLVGRAADHRDADLLRDLVAHLRQARARDQERDAHLRRLDHHLRGQPAGRVEDLVARRRCGRATSGRRSRRPRCGGRRPRRTSGSRARAAVVASRARSRAPRRPACRSSRAGARGRAARRASPRASVASAGSRTLSISSIRSPNTVPWPQPVVVGALAASSRRGRRGRAAS